MSERKQRNRRSKQLKGKSFRSKVLGIINSDRETKFKDHFNFVAVGSNASLSPLSFQLTAISTGDSHDNREGEKIRLMSFSYKGTVLTGDATNILRMIVYRPYNISADLNADAFEINSRVDPHKYFVYVDKLVTVDTANPLKQFNLNVKFGGSRGIPITYDGTATTSVSKNKILVYIVSDSAAVTHPSVQAQGRVWYKDN